MNTDIKKLTDETPMVGVATAALTGYALRYAMAAATGLLAELRWGWSNHFSFIGMWTDDHGCYDPVNDWEIGGPLIAEYAIGFLGHDADNWLAFSSPMDETHQGIGPTHLIAACRMIVASHFGDTVSVPVELFEASV
jgi:hypothetical protein